MENVDKIIIFASLLFIVFIVITSVRTISATEAIEIAKNDSTTQQAMSNFAFSKGDITYSVKLTCEPKCAENKSFTGTTPFSGKKICSGHAFLCQTSRLDRCVNIFDSTKYCAPEKEYWEVTASKRSTGGMIGTETFVSVIITRSGAVLGYTFPTTLTTDV
jgi:hypothetical protein